MAIPTTLSTISLRRATTDCLKVSNIVLTQGAILPALSFYCIKFSASQAPSNSSFSHVINRTSQTFCPALSGLLPTFGTSTLPPTFPTSESLPDGPRSASYSLHRQAVAPVNGHCCSCAGWCGPGITLTWACGRKFRRTASLYRSTSIFRASPGDLA